MFILVDKPCGVTSFQVTKCFRKLFNTKKIGHLGTLDPAASGLMLLATDPKFLPYLQYPYFKHDTKVYVFKVRFGMATDSLDLDGTCLEKNAIRPTLDQICSIISNFVGKIEQIPPKFSAIRIQGKRAYALARAGCDFDVPKRVVEIVELQFLSFDGEEAEFRVRCSAGTYVRTLGIDIAAHLGCIGVISELRREEIGIFSINSNLNMIANVQKRVTLSNDAQKSETVTHVVRYRMESLEIFTQIYAKFELQPNELEKLRNGVKISMNAENEQSDKVLKESSLEESNNVYACVDRFGKFLGIISTVLHERHAKMNDRCDNQYDHLLNLSNEEERGTIFALRMVKI